MYHEIQGLGYPGGLTIVRDFVQRLRSKQGLPPKARSFPDSQLKNITPRQAAHIILMKPDDYDEELRQTLDHIRNLSDEIRQVVTLVQDFATILRQKQVERFNGWLIQAEAAPALQCFARGLRHDYQAIRAALSETWSNGQVEGQVNRLKFIKRQMYGRANFDLLRIRVLAG